MGDCGWGLMGGGWGWGFLGRHRVGVGGCGDWWREAGCGAWWGRVQTGQLRCEGEEGRGGMLRWRLLAGLTLEGAVQWMDATVGFGV